MKTQISLGFHAKRSEEEAKKSSHPNATRFLMEVIKAQKDYVIFIATDCGDGNQRFNTAKDVNEEVARARKTFVEKGGWTIIDHETVEVDE